MYLFIKTTCILFIFTLNTLQKLREKKRFFGEKLRFTIKMSKNKSTYFYTSRTHFHNAFIHNNRRKRKIDIPFSILLYFVSCCKTIFETLLSRSFLGSNTNRSSNKNCFYFLFSYFILN